MKKSFDEYWTPEPNTGCHLWTGGLTGEGYGNFWDGERQQAAHRVSWFKRHGAIPSGIKVLHSCDTPSCVNPTHLFLGTNADNSRDMVSKGRSARGGRLPHSKLTEADVALIRGTPKGEPGLTKRLGISRSDISLIRSGKIWKHI